MPWVAVGVMAAATVAGTVTQMAAARQAGAVQADTANINARLRARELISQAQISENQALVSEREATLSEQAATGIREATAFDVARQKEQGRAFQSAQRAAIAGSGLEATGSPLLVMGETAKQLELDRLVQTHAGEQQAREAEEGARMERYGAKLSRYQAEQLRKGIPLTLDIGRYQARAARQGARLQGLQTIIGAAGRGAGMAADFYR